ncbi:glycoside hydrolase family 3 protein [Mycena albidolilacea]|uniref:beta-glucosidase n=1 Tax=Mycena albidolilacea TaxID=1033008 RepID=A0AAD7ET91_9AGAR|nr:glycoside hydrolase family 3 protein [Mycena albidolilacea]
MAENRSFLEADIAHLVRKLTTNEKISLLGAPNWWNTTSIPRLKIPSIRMSDGPNGVRGSSHFVAAPAQCIPCATAMASTFDTDLIQKVGGFLAAEAKVKSSVVLLAPTCNIQRSPLGGRAFESFSEDPHLSGTMAAAYVNGLQAEGVSATIKHFVANDQEHERTAAESVVSDRALREIYLYPFMLAQLNAKPGAYMTSYGRIQGIHCSENRPLLQGILRDEWKFNGLVISDWYGTYAVDQALNAGLDLEMPGPPRWRTPVLVNHCLTSQKLSLSTLNERVKNLLTFVQNQARKNPEVVYGDGAERTRDSPEARRFCRQLAADGIVLLKNQDNLLPLSSKTKRLAIMGPNALQHIISGGGSAALKPSYSVSPYDGVVSEAPADTVIEYAVGCYAHKYLPTLENNLKTASGEPGWLCTFYNHDSEGQLTDPVAGFVIKDTRIKLVDFLPPGLTENWTIKLTGQLTVDKTAPFQLGLTVAGRAKLWVNGNLTIDNWTKQTPGDFFYGQGTIEEKAVIDLSADVAVDVLVEYTNTSPPKEEEDVSSQPALMLGVRLGGCEKIDADAAVESAIALAAKCDAVLFVAGLTPEWESEGFDRPTLSLPGRQDEVISKIAAANPNTIVCIQAGSATSMPWVGKAAAVIQAWYLGNEVGNAIADVVWGKVNPGGRLPLTFPVRIEDTPAYLNERSENGKIHYREDLFVGYKHYHARAVKPLFPFGFGLSYTTFSFSDLVVSGVQVDQTGLITFSVALTVKNEGLVAGSEVAQLYISYPDTGLTTPVHQLKGFTKAKDVAPGASRDLNIDLDKYALAFWNSTTNEWTISPGKYILHVGASSEDFRLKGELELTKGITWQGL